MAKRKLTKKVKNLIKSDVMSSVALVSILINVFFFSGVVLFSATNQLDVAMYEASVKNLCIENYESNLSDEMEKASDANAARANFEIACHSGEFNRYYENAVEAYLSDTL